MESLKLELHLSSKQKENDFVILTSDYYWYKGEVFFCFIIR